MLKDGSTPVPAVLRRTFPESKILVAIPAFNEGPTIGSVVLKARQFASEVVVIDDGSADDTADTAALAGAHVIRHARNLGKGMAVRSAWLYARERGLEALVLLDGDHQHDPNDIPRLLEPILAGEADVVLGVRWGKTSGMPAYRRVGKRVLDYATAAATRNGEVTDSQCGYRAFSNQALQKMEPTEHGLAIDSQLLIDAQDRRLRIKRVNIEVRYDVDGSTTSPGRHGAGVLSRLVILLTERRPLFFFGASGTLLLAAAGLLGILVLKTFFETHILAVGYSFIVVILSILGALSTFLGIVLNVIRRLTRV